jgi:hypothetical protein
VTGESGRKINMIIPQAAQRTPLKLISRMKKRKEKGQRQTEREYDTNSHYDKFIFPRWQCTANMANSVA